MWKGFHARRHHCCERCPPRQIEQLSQPVDVFLRKCYCQITALVWDLDGAELTLRIDGGWRPIEVGYSEQTITDCL